MPLIVNVHLKCRQSIVAEIFYRLISSRLNADTCSLFFVEIFHRLILSSLNSDNAFWSKYFYGLIVSTSNADTCTMFIVEIFLMVFLCVDLKCRQYIFVEIFSRLALMQTVRVRVGKSSIVGVL
jgi:hypothetical protein